MLAETVFTITMYAVGCDVKSGSKTKAGTTPVVDFTAASDPSVLPIGSIVEIDGFDGERMVHDTGGKVKGRQLDLFVHNCKYANNWGRKKRSVVIKHIGGTK